VDHTALLALDDVIRDDCRAAEWLAALKTFGAFIWRRPVAEALSALGVTCKKPRFLDAKWVANLELSSFLTTFRWEIEEVRCSIRVSVPPEWNHLFDEVNEACHFAFLSMLLRRMTPPSPRFT
jgi:hypothetical protein